MTTTRISETEAGFLGAVIDLARLRQWRIAHFRPAQMRSGRWVTPMQGDPGFPDIVLARRGRGLSEEAAMAMIVRGFIEPIAKELPMEYAVDRAWMKGTAENVEPASRARWA